MEFKDNEPATMPDKISVIYNEGAAIPPFVDYDKIQRDNMAYGHKTNCKLEAMRHAVVIDGGISGADGVISEAEKIYTWLIDVK